MSRRPARGSGSPHKPPLSAPAGERSLIMMGRFVDDLLVWSRTEPRMVIRVLELVQSIVRDPKHGIGEPEPLKHNLSGCWSRRIDREHRLVYEILPDRIKLLSARYHYSK